MDIARLPSEEQTKDCHHWALVLRLVRAVDGTSEEDFAQRLTIARSPVETADVEDMETGLLPVSPATQLAALRLLLRNLDAIENSVAVLRERYADPGWGTVSVPGVSSRAG